MGLEARFRRPTWDDAAALTPFDGDCTGLDGLVHALESATEGFELFNNGKLCSKLPPLDEHIRLDTAA